MDIKDWVYISVYHGRQNDSTLAFKSSAVAKTAFAAIKQSMENRGSECLEIEDDFGTTICVAPSEISAVRLQPVEGGRQLQINGQLEGARVNQLAQEEGQKDFGASSPIVQPSAVLTDHRGRPFNQLGKPGNVRN